MKVLVLLCILFSECTAHTINNNVSVGICVKAIQKTLIFSLFSITFIEIGKVINLFKIYIYIFIIILSCILDKGSLKIYQMVNFKITYKLNKYF